MSCGKKPYFSRQVAKNARRQLRKGGFKLTNVYFCDSCQAYHLTSMDKVESRSKKRKHKFEVKEDPEVLRLRKEVMGNE